MSGEQNSAPGSTRRRVMGAFLGGGILATFASFLYPLLRYIVPPPVADLGVNEVIAGKVGELKPNSGAIFRFGSRPGLLILASDGSYQALSARCRPRRERSHSRQGRGAEAEYRSNLPVWQSSRPAHPGQRRQLSSALRPLPTSA